MPFRFPPADDLPGGGVGFGWVDAEPPPAAAFDAGIDFCAPVDVVIVVVADWSDPMAPCVPLPTVVCLPRLPRLPR